MNFDVHRNQQLLDHLSQYDCECVGNEFCEICDPAEYALRQEEERAELKNI